MKDLLSASDANKVSVFALLDLSAAFDTIDHSLLLQRFSHSFVVSGLVFLFCFFLFFVFNYPTAHSPCGVNSLYPSISVFKFGATQGSVLGPTHFGMYTSPVSDIVKHSMQHGSFADDTMLQRSGNLTQNNTNNDLNQTKPHV